MNMTSNLTIELTKTKKEIPSFDDIGFGKYYSDHMFIMDYDEGKDWHNPRIVPYRPIELDPSAQVFHYGQTVFEGLKAYRTEDNRILLFRPEKNMERMNQSNERLSIPTFDEKVVLDALKKLVDIDRDWVPNIEGTSLYIRPFVIPTESNVNLKPSSHYQLIIICSPVGSIYPEGINPVKIYVENEFVRAAPGGTGIAKTGGNYAGSFKAQTKASNKGFTQVLWLDAVERKYIEEVGSMNVFFNINGEIITPELNGSILHGITRNSTIELLKHWGVPVKERKISIDEINQAYEDGLLKEAFGTGTAAVISPIGELNWGDKKMVLNKGKTGELSRKIYETMTGIQKGEVEDPFNWIVDLG